MITSPFLAFLMGRSPMELFERGGVMMWPILFVSFVALTVVVERAIFLLREKSSRDPDLVEKMLDHAGRNDITAAVRLGESSQDLVARVLTDALTHREHSLSAALLRAANRELTRFHQGLAVLDTCITAAPLLGLLGTVTGMMNTFGALGAGGDIAANAGQITGGVGEALIATMCGLAIAILCLFPYNVLNTRIEEVRHDLADAASALELIAKKATAP
ncbi:MAG: MotA/TolQ/ExbB proton channel family protein [Verrucomicrobiota bacterium]